MKKNSLKKVEEISSTPIRPLSRGKLSSLTKKDSLLITSKKDILEIRPSSKQ